MPGMHLRHVRRLAFAPSVNIGYQTPRGRRLRMATSDSCGLENGRG